MVLIARVSSGIDLLFTNFSSSTRRRVYSGRHKLDINVNDNTGPAKPLPVLKPQMSPVSMPGEDIIFIL